MEQIAHDRSYGFNVRDKADRGPHGNQTLFSIAIPVAGIPRKTPADQIPVGREFGFALRFS